MSEQPLVSVGIPTYNRPAGLRRVLECMTTQTYQNLEIIISDNASSDPQVEKVALEFAGRDKRIKYYRQEENKGVGYNFKFVLEQARGEYFMWAADDDDWESNFIEVCMHAMLRHNVGSVMTGYKKIYHGKQKAQTRTVPELSDMFSIKKNYLSYLLNIHPPLFYGIHKKETIKYFVDLPLFDWNDVYLVLRQILEHGFFTIPTQYLFLYGVASDGYEYKPTHPCGNRLFEYKLVIIHGVRSLFAAKRIGFFVKLQLFYAFLKRMMQLFVFYEKKTRPRQVQLASIVLRFFNCFEWVEKGFNYFRKKLAN